MNFSQNRFSGLFASQNSEFGQNDSDLNDSDASLDSGLNTFAPVFKTPGIPKTPKTPSTPFSFQPIFPSSAFGSTSRSGSSSGFVINGAGINRGLGTRSSSTPSPIRELRTPFSSKSNINGRSSKTSNLRTPRTGNGTQSTSTVTTGGMPKIYVIVAIVEGRGLAKGEIGLASMEIHHPELCVSQFSDTGNYTKLRVKLHILNPSEILVPDSAVEKGGNMLALLATLKQDFPKMKVTPVKRRFFNEGQGIELISRIKTDDCTTVEKDIQDKYYGLACGAALVRHIEYVQNIVFAKRSVKVVYKGTEKTCMIDLGTAKHLELIVNLQDVTDVDNSLYGVLNHTFTAGGARMLRASLLQPSADIDLITARLDAVTELKRDIPQFHTLRSLLSRMLDVDHLVALCSHLNREETARTADYKITQTIHLKHTLELVDALRESLSRYSNPLFKSFHEMLVDDRFREILEKIGNTLREETRYDKNALNMLGQKCFAVKPNINGYLDVARRTYSELVEDVQELCSDMVEETGLPFTIAYTNRRDFYLQMRLKEDAPLPTQIDTSCLINLVRKANTISCTTRNLVKLNDRITQTVNEIFCMSNAVVSQLLEEIRDSITCLYNLTEVISTVDFICSLILFCASCPNGFVRPEFGDTLAISQGRHPLLEKVCEEPSYYPNDVYAGPEANIIVITGPNMAGKSTYLKMVAVLHVLAQMGSYVPASYASFRMTEQIFSRIGQNDELESHSSAFMLEMKDMNYIMQNVGETGGDKSLIIIDELARSTSPEEGYSICHAICESLVNTTAFVFFATHFLELAVLDSLYHNVENFHFEGENNAEEDASRLVTNHTLKRGPYRGPTYGFEVAELANMPPQIFAKAKVAAEKMRDKCGVTVRDEVDTRKERAIMRLGQRLIHASHMERMEPAKFAQYLKHLKSQFMEDTRYAEAAGSISYAEALSTSPSTPLGSAPSSSF